MGQTHTGNALITGAAKRIGRDIALHLAQLGWNIAIHCRNSTEAATTLKAQIEALGVQALICQADLAVEREVEQLFDHASQELGPLTCLVNNASIFEEDTVANATREMWDRHMEVNFRAPFVLSQKFARGLGDEKTGCIINITDQRVWNPTPDFTSYTLSKMALWDMTQVLAKSLAPQIRVNAVGPGPTLQSIHQTAEDFSQEVAAVPLQRDVDPNDISRGVQFILESPTMTGQMIALDSGQHMGWLPPKGITK